MRTLTMAAATVLVLVSAARGEGTNLPAKPVQTNRVQIALLPPDVEAKISSILIPAVHWTNTPLADAVAFLNNEARKADPEKKGVEIVLETSEERTITFGVRNARLKVVLTAICRFAHMSVRAERGKIILTDGSQGGMDKASGAPVF